MAKSPKFYPILPGQKRQKRRYGPREYGSATTVPCTYRKYQQYISTNKSTNTTSGIFVQNDFTVNMGDSSKVVIKLPGWRQLVSKGSDATNNYNREIRHIQPATYTVRSENSSFRNNGFGNDNGTALENQRDSTALKDMAVGRLKHKLDGYIGRAELAAPIAESREIHRLVKQVNGLAMDMLKAALALKKTKGKSAAKAFGDVWLGYGFGVAPMINDLKNASNAILEYNTREDRTVRVSGGASTEYTSGQVLLPVSTICPGCQTGFTSLAEHKLGIRIVAGVDLRTRSAASYGMDDQLGLTLGDVPGAIWELTPFSWVVDYFTTVGDWVDDMFYTVPGTVKYVSQSEKYQVKTTGWMTHKFLSGYSGEFLSTPSVYQYVNFSRTKLTTLPTRGLRIKTTDEIAKHGLSKLLNLGSVLVQGLDLGADLTARYQRLRR